MPIFVIEARDPRPKDADEAQADEGWGELPSSHCGRESEALEIVRELQAFGEEWACKEYRVVPRKKSIAYLARQKAKEANHSTAEKV